MDAQRFPLTQLPNTCSQNILRIMNPVEMVGFSLNSTKCKRLVKSLKLNAEPMQITFRSYLEIDVELPKRQFLVLNFYRNNPEYLWESGNHGLKKQLKTPRSVSLRFPHNDPNESEWNIDRLGLREWLEHLQFVFNSSIVIGVRFAEESFHFDVDSVKSTLPNIIKLGCPNIGSQDFTQLILKNFLPTESILIEPSCFIDSEIPPHILMQNFYTIRISEQHPIQTHFKLNDLLLTNAIGYAIFDLVLDVKELNRFLKLWIKGAAPRMECLFFEFSNGNEIDRDGIMKGIKYQKMPSTLKRTFFNEKSLVCGGMDFYRYDGVKATVCYGSFRFAMHVWFDHRCAP